MKKTINNHYQIGDGVYFVMPYESSISYGTIKAIYIKINEEESEIKYEIRSLSDDFTYKFTKSKYITNITSHEFVSKDKKSLTDALRTEIIKKAERIIEYNSRDVRTTNEYVKKIESITQTLTDHLKEYKLHNNNQTLSTLQKTLKNI